MWKNLKSYFIIEEEGANQPAAPDLAKPGPSPKLPAGVKKNAEAIRVEQGKQGEGTTAGAVNDRFVQVLMEAMEGVNLPGFDYLEYKKSLQNLKKMNFNDDVLYRTAYAAAQSMGVTSQDLVASAQHYLGALGKEEAKFGQALKGQESQQIQDKETRLKSLGATIQQHQAQIKALQEQIQKVEAEQKELQDAILANADKLAKTKADFEYTYTLIAGGIKKDIEKMQEYLK
ncbi:hypothetical protein QWY85_11615 [Neolewinella lacunae]|uniref:Uncharacterized protein n=1 Tax=Neolewinella lacunae TaxID=1517758 RepID=A0A923PJG7_9BACT|nr:hypothetical protein [Neolewinella lacunae]MBC6993801.1 hypothetical protein [Neolewinella lacunae]MDN3635308.1 hypothetical protein [Neolewinella lacunae]